MGFPSCFDNVIPSPERTSAVRGGDGLDGLARKCRGDHNGEGGFWQPASNMAEAVAILMDTNDFTRLSGHKIQRKP